ncbi:MAG TPA: hypothetical protein VGI23_22390 [Steroidobacteraceae bacterium]
MRSRPRLVEILASLGIVASVQILGLFALTTVVAQAAPATVVGPIVITVPPGFVAAQTQKTRKTLITAWTKSVKDGSSKTLLQINVLELAKPAAPAEAEKYLRHELAAIERRRLNYTSSPVAHIQLAGVPDVRATWNGNIGGYPVMGVLYSVIVKDRFVVKFLAQDLGTTPTDGLFEAMKAIESMGMS